MAPPAPADRPLVCPRDETCPSPRHHDTYRGYLAGCRSRPATDGNAEHSQAWRDGERRTADATGTIRRLRALVLRGWTTRELARRLYCVDRYVQRLANGAHGRVWQTTAERVDEVWVELAETDPPPPGPQTGRMIRRALSKGWAPVEAWDYVDIDDPTAVAWDQPTPGRLLIARKVEQAAEDRARVVELTRAGSTREAIARDVRLSERAVDRHRERARELGELPPLETPAELDPVAPAEDAA